MIRPGSGQGAGRRNGRVSMVSRAAATLCGC